MIEFAGHLGGQCPYDGVAAMHPRVHLGAARSAAALGPRQSCGPGPEVANKLDENFRNFRLESARDGRKIRVTVLIFSKILPTPHRGSRELGYTTLSVISIIFIVFCPFTIKNN
jgi:hypothetical protein